MYSAAAAAVCVLWCYTSVMLLPTPFYLLVNCVQQWALNKIIIVTSPTYLEKFARRNVKSFTTFWLSFFLLPLHRTWNINYSTLACGARGPRIEPVLRTSFCVFTKITAIRSFGHGLHTDCSAYVDSAFHPPRDGKWVSTLWLSNNTWRWANVRPIAAYRRTQRSSLQPGLQGGGHLALTDFHSKDTTWTLAYGFTP